MREMDSARIPASQREEPREARSEEHFSGGLGAPAGVLTEGAEEEDWGKYQSSKRESSERESSKGESSRNGSSSRDGSSRQHFSEEDLGAHGPFSSEWDGDPSRRARRKEAEGETGRRRGRRSARERAREADSRERQQGRRRRQQEREEKRRWDEEEQSQEKTREEFSETSASGASASGASASEEELSRRMSRSRKRQKRAKRRGKPTRLQRRRSRKTSFSFVVLTASFFWLGLSTRIGSYDPEVVFEAFMQAPLGPTWGIWASVWVAVLVGVWKAGRRAAGFMSRLAYKGGVFSGLFFSVCFAVRTVGLSESIFGSDPIFVSLPIPDGGVEGLLWGLCSMLFMMGSFSFADQRKAETRAEKKGWLRRIFFVGKSSRR